jgi:hypothetical protein
MSSLVICIEAMDEILHQCIAMMILRIYRSLALTDSTDQWWSTEDYVESVGWGFFFLGIDASCQDDGAASPVSDHQIQ